VERLGNGDWRRGSSSRDSNLSLPVIFFPRLCASIRIDPDQCDLFRSDRDFSAFSPQPKPTYLAPLHHLASFIPHETSKIVALCTHSMTYYIFTARLLANHVAENPDSSTVQQTFEVLQEVWDRSDIYNAWISDCYALIQTPGATRIGAADSAVLEVSLSCFFFLGILNRAHY